MDSVAGQIEIIPNDIHINNDHVKFIITSNDKLL